MSMDLTFVILKKMNSIDWFTNNYKLKILNLTPYFLLQEKNIKFFLVFIRLKLTLSIGLVEFKIVFETKKTIFWKQPKAYRI